MLFNLFLKVELGVGLKPDANLQLIVKRPIESAVVQIDSHGVSADRPL